ncbi:MAG: small ribosomal subunit Rsm22 family protein [Dongiaceae bacterium]
MAAELPSGVRARVAAMLDGVSRAGLSARAARLSEAYRAGGGSARAIADPTDVLAYLVTRMPATHAAVAAALRQFRLVAPDFAPTSLLDVGAGPGTASFAAGAAWPEIAAVAMIDSNPRFVAAAGDLAAASGHPALAAGQRILGDANRFGRDLPSADLVVAAYSLAEVGDGDAFVAALWKASAGALMLVEPGTPDGFARIRAARTGLIAAGASMAAPCPHDRACPIVAPDWCHFSERLQRSRDHRMAKGADLSFEDEKFAYVVAVRPSVRLARPGARVLAEPRASKAGLQLKLCWQDGTIADLAVPRRDRAAHAALRRVRWGDALDQSGSHGLAAESKTSGAGSTSGDGFGGQ